MDARSSRVQQLGTRLIESAWLIAVIVVPLFFNVWSHRVFEPDKLTHLRSLALLMVATAFVLWIEHPPKLSAAKDWLKIPLVGPVLLQAAIIGIASLTSFTPRLSLDGSYVRLQGFYTFCAYVVLFLAIVGLLRRKDQLDRLVTAVILPSLPVALYGVVQRYGADPMPWLGDVTVRVASTMGNSIFVAAYLILAVPLTAVRLIEAVGDLDEEDEEEGAMVNAAVLRVAGYLVMIAVQLAAIVLSGSRGPMIGLIGGGFFFVLMLAVLKGRRNLILGALGLGVAVALFLAVFNLPNSPIEGLRDAPYIGRLGQIFETESGTGKVRVLIWGGAVDLITSDPTRTLIGWGPESMHLAYNPFYPPELGNYEARNASPDRSHNETFDALATTGVLGLLVYLYLFTSLFYFGLKWLGLISSSGERLRFLALWLGGGLLSVLAFYQWRQDFTFFGVALPAGMIAGLLIYVTWQALAGWQAPERQGRLLIVGLLAAVIAHFLEIHFGIAIAATRTLFFVMAALLVVVGTMPEENPELLSEAETATGSATKKRTKKRRTTRPEPVGLGPGFWLWAERGILMLTVLVTLFWDFIVDPNMTGSNFLIIVWLVGLTWAIGSLVIGTENFAALASRRIPPRRGLGAYLLITLGFSSAYALSHSGFLAQEGGRGAETMNGLLMMYDFTLLMIWLAWAWVLSQTERTPEAFSLRGPVAFLYPFALLVALGLAMTTNINKVRADIYYKEAWAGFHAQAGNSQDYTQAMTYYEYAILDYDRALELNPNEDYYMLFKGKALLERAAREASRFDQQYGQQIAQGMEAGGFSEYDDSAMSGDAAIRDRQFEAAIQNLNQALDAAPKNPDHTANLGRAYQIWGDSTYDPGKRTERLARSVSWFETVIAPDLSPKNAGLREELATTHFIAGDHDSANTRIDEALQIDPDYGRPYRLRARILREEEDWEGSEQAYREYFKTRDGRGDIAAWSELAWVLGQAGDLVGAMEANQRVNDINLQRTGQPDVTSLSNMAILERDLGNPEAACEYVAQGVAVRPDDNMLNLLIDELNCNIELPSPEGDLVDPSGMFEDDGGSSDGEEAGAGESEAP